MDQETKELEHYVDPSDIHYDETTTPGYKHPIQNTVFRLRPAIVESKNESLSAIYDIPFTSQLIDPYEVTVQPAQSMFVEVTFEGRKYKGTLYLVEERQ